MNVNKELLKGSTGILILNLLDQRAMYGYEMIKTLEERSNGVFSFKEGTLYPLLHSLEQKGLLQSYWQESDKGRKRKYYQITDTGRSHFASKKDEWKLFRSAVDQVLGEAFTYA